MEKTAVIESLVGEKVTIVCRDRKETVYEGQLLELNRLGAVIKLKEHGRDFIEVIPFFNISFVSHKILGKS